MEPRPVATTEVALPMLTLVPGGMGGSETYARALTRELAGRPGLSVTAYVCAAAEGFSEGVPEHVERSIAGGSSTVARVATQVRAAASSSLRRAVAGADVVHYPLTVPSPAAGHGPRVVTLLDVQHHDLPELFTPAERAYRSLVYDRPARAADAIVTISEFSRRQIVHHLAVDPDRVHVAHLAVDHGEFTPHLGTREPFVLYPARPWPHKNHALLLEAMAVVRRTRPDLRLVLTGGGLEALGPLPDWVECRGLVPRGELRELYRRASCLVFPSRYEGFGLPPLEAMASGCPVAAADSGSLPEVCGDAAARFGADDVPAMAAAVLAAVQDDAGVYSRRGLARAAAFSWSACADVHQALYAELHEGGPGRRTRRRRGSTPR